MPPVIDNPLMYSPPANRDVNWEAVVTVDPPRKCRTCKTVYPSDDDRGPLKDGTPCYACWAKGGGHGKFQTAE